MNGRKGGNFCRKELTSFCSESDHNYKISTTILISDKCFCACALHQAVKNRIKLKIAYDESKSQKYIETKTCVRIGINN